MTIHTDALMPYLHGTVVFLLVLLFSGICAPPILDAFTRGRLVTGGVFSLIYGGGVFLIAGVSTGYVQFAH